MEQQVRGNIVFPFVESRAMGTSLKRFGTVALGLLALGLAEAAAHAQAPPQQAPPQPNPGFRAGQAAPALTGPGAARAYINNPGGFNYTLALANAPGGAYGLLSNSPYSGMTSQPYQENANNYNGYYGGGDPFGGYLQGAAGVIDAQGRYLLNTQRAYLLREQVRQAQLDYRRRLFDEWLYERNNTPTRQDNIERTAQQELRYSRFNPDKPDIWSGRALNIILDDLKRLDRQAPGGDRTIDENILKKINVTSGKANSNLGVLKNDGKIEWPLGLLDTSLGERGEELRRQIQTLTRKAYNEAKDARPPDPGTIKEIRASIKQLENVLRGNVGTIEFSQYVEAKNYLKQLNDAVNLLQEKNAADYINGKFSLGNLKNNAIADVVKYMTDNGLQFAPAVDGDQEAYIALHRALANYDSAANTLATQQK